MRMEVSRFHLSERDSQATRAKCLMLYLCNDIDLRLLCIIVNRLRCNIEFRSDTGFRTFRQKTLFITPKGR